MRSHEKLLLENKAWAEETKQRQPGYFERLAHGQQPEFLWIGCAVSRVSTGTQSGYLPGSVLVKLARTDGNGACP